MKSYIKPEVKVYKVRIEPLLSGSGPEDGQIGRGLVKKYDPSLLMRKMMTDRLVATVFGMTKTLKIE